MSDENPVVITLVIGIVLVAAGGYLYYSDQQATANAVEVEATVLSSDVYDDNPGDAAGDGRNDQYRADIEYRYTYEGETYTSTSICPGAGSGCAPTGEYPDEVEEFVSEYPEGETVTAHVQQDDPSQSHLVEDGSPTLYLGLAGVGVLVVLLGVRNFLVS